MRVALYLRVSKRDGTQDPENQRRALEELAARRGWVVGKIYQDTQSGRRGRLDRQEFDQMLRAAARHEQEHARRAHRRRRTAGGTARETRAGTAFAGLTHFPITNGDMPDAPV